MSTPQASRITKLSEDVINRIAAGEVIQRPSNALKELLENALDAGSTQIRIFLRDGGITELRIEDNGGGILPEDFPLLCERFATSKLAKFEDLYSIATYGFRGEALASISFCAQLCITSKTQNQSCAYRAHFINGHMYDPNQPDLDHKQIKASMVAGMPGTQITVKKLFYNMSLRQKALKSRWSQQYNLCLRVVSCYAIHNVHCSFAVQKLSDNAPPSLDLNCKARLNKNCKAVIKCIYGGDIASYLIDIHKQHDKIRDLVLDGVISNCDFAMNVASSAHNKSRNKAKKRIFNTNNKMELVLFINHRLVESQMIKKSIMSVYEDYLAKNHHPFVYLSLLIPANLVDVNVHPTKKEVRFLHKDQVLQLIQDAINEKLKVENDSRTFHAQSLQHFMSQSNVNTVITMSNDNDRAIQETKGKEEREHVVLKEEEEAFNSNNGKVGTLLNLDDSDEETQPSDDEMVDIDEGDGDNNNNSISPHAPLRRSRRRKKALISNVSYTNLSDINISEINMDDSSHINHNNNNNNNNSNRVRKRKRSYSELISTSDDEEIEQHIEHNHSLNINCTQPMAPNIITVDLNEKKKSKKTRKSTRVRTDAQQSSLDYYWNKNKNVSKRSKRRKVTETVEKKEEKMTESENVNHAITFLAKKEIQKKVIKAPECMNELISMIDENSDPNLKKLFEENVYVGCVDNDTFERVVFQYDTKLFLCNIHRISRVYFFEICVKNIGKFRCIYKLIANPPGSIPTIYDLIMLALELEESDFRHNQNVAGSKEEIAQSVTDTLCQPSIAKLLFDYFSIEIDIENKTIQSIPCLIDGYIPGLLYLPMFLFRLVTEITWFKAEDDSDTNEIVFDSSLFKQISMEIARFYQIRPSQFYFKLAETKETKKKRFGGYLNKTDNVNNKDDLGWILQHVLFRSMNRKCTKYSFNPPKFLCNDGSVVQIACTKQLYKVFERC